MGKRFKYKIKFDTSYEIGISGNGKYLARIGSKVNIYDAITWKEVASFGQFKNPSYLAFSPNSDLLAVKSTLGRIGLFDLNALEMIKTYSPTKSEGRNICFSPDDKYIISIENNGIALIDINSDKVRVLNKGTTYEGFIEYVPGNNTFLFMVSGFHTGQMYDTLFKCQYPFDQHRWTETRIPNNGQWVHYGLNIKYSSLLYFNVQRFGLGILDNNFNQTGKTAVENDGISYFNTLKCSASGLYIALALNHAAYIFRYPELKLIKKYELEYLCFADFSSDDRYLLLGTWESGYCIEMADVEKVKLFNSKIKIEVHRIV